ncbi:MAG: hypothetical protein AB1941_28770 [Gemmatimonadota bacterium]
MSFIAMMLACCTAASPVTNTPAQRVDTVAVYAQIIGAIRAELKPGAHKIYLAEERFQPPRYTGDPHRPELLRELVSRGIVDSLYLYEQRRPGYPCGDCTRIVLSSIAEFERVLYADPGDFSEEVEPSKGVPVKHWVDVNLARVCIPQSLRDGSCNEDPAGAGPCRAGEEHSRRYFFTLEPDGALRIVGCAVTRVI